MKKIQQFALMSAIVLTGAVGFTSCSSSEDVPEQVSSRYNPETNEVGVNFVFNVSTGNGTTRQTSAATQATEDDLFRGIDNTILFSFKQGADGKHLAAATTSDKRYDLAQILGPNTVSKEMSRRVIETSLPINTNTILFYGKAIAGDAYGSSYTANDLFGHLDEYTLPAGGANLSDVTISLGQRLTGDNLTTYRQVEDLLSAVLTSVMATNLAGDKHVTIVATDYPMEGVSAYGFDVATTEYPADLTWESYANVDGKSPMEPTHDLYPLEKKLADIYREMTTIQQSAGELRAGSGYALQLVMHDLWANINEVRCATPLNKPETVAKFLAHEITVEIKKYFTSSTLPIDGTAPENVSFRSLESIIRELSTDPTWPATADAKPTVFSNISSSFHLVDFPYYFGVPRAAAHLQFDTAKKQFKYVKYYNTSAVGDVSGFTVESYCYPAELMYFGNSPVRVSNLERKTNNYPATVADWDNDAKWSSDWVKSSHVTSGTQGVAMQNDINYGSALLKTTVRYGTTTLSDNNHAIQKAKQPNIADTDEPDKQITVDGTSFKLTGIVIGGQVKKVGWNYIAREGAKFTSYVYDRAIASDVIPVTGTSTPNYTLLFDNYHAGEAHQDKVYVALEFLNNTGEDFFGEHGMVRNQSHFYLIGELDPEKNGLNTVTWPTHHPLPPYNADGTSIKTQRVFMQDFMTTADFVIGANSLKHAYLTVPDLRYSSLTLGLSVDVKWSTGLNFEEVILGGN